jgi:hypothetical protein
MPSVPGTIQSDGNSFQATFTIGGVPYNGVGTFEPNVPAFTSSDATMNYTSTDELVGTIPGIGLIGLSQLTLTIGPNPGDGSHTVISGKLDNPISQINSVTFQVTWKHN